MIQIVRDSDTISQTQQHQEPGPESSKQTVLQPSISLHFCPQQLLLCVTRRSGGKWMPLQKFVDKYQHNGLAT